MKPTPPRPPSMKAPPPALPKPAGGKPPPPPMPPLTEATPAKTQPVPPKKAAAVPVPATKAVSLEDELKSKMMQRLTEKAGEGTTVAIAKPPVPKQETEFEAKMRMRKLKREQSQSQEKQKEVQPSGGQAGAQPAWRAQLKSTAPPQTGPGFVSSHQNPSTFPKPSTSTPRPMAQTQRFGPSPQTFGVQLKPTGAAATKPKPMVPKKSAVTVGGVRHPTVGGFRASPAVGGFKGAPAVGGFRGSPTVGGFKAAPAVGGFRASPTVGGFRPSPSVRPAPPPKPSNITLNASNVDKFNEKLELTKWRKNKSCKLTVC